jgi:TolA-binding protein
MKNFALLVLLPFILFLLSCNNEQLSQQEAISKLEATIDENPTSENASALIKAYDNYISKYPEDEEYNSKLLYRAAALQYRMNRFNGALNKLTKIIKDYYETSTSPKAAIFLGDIYLEKLSNPENAYSIYQTLIKAFPNAEESKQAAEKLPAGLPAIEDRMKALGEQIYNDSLHRIEYRTANNYIYACEVYALMLPDAENTPEILFKGGEVARSIKSFNKALDLYKTINDDYPEHEKAAQALFMRAFTYDSDMKQVEEARTLYESFIEKYPQDTAFTASAKVLLENLGKDDEEIIKAITKGAKEKDYSKDKSQPKLKEAVEE